MRRPPLRRLLGLACFAAFTAACLIAALSVNDAGAASTRVPHAIVVSPLVAANPALTTPTTATGGSTATSPSTTPATTAATSTAPEPVTTVYLLEVTTIVDEVDTVTVWTTSTTPASATPTATTPRTTTSATTRPRTQTTTVKTATHTTTTATHTATQPKVTTTTAPVSVPAASLGEVLATSSVAPVSEPAVSAAPVDHAKAKTKKAKTKKTKKTKAKHAKKKTKKKTAKAKKKTKKKAKKHKVQKSERQQSTTQTSPTHATAVATGGSGQGPSASASASAAPVVHAQPAVVHHAAPRYSYSHKWSAKSTAPSPVTNSLATVAKTVSNPARVSVALGTGVVWTLLLVLAVGLMEKTLKTLYETWNAALSGGLSRMPARVQAGFAYVTSGALPPLLGVLAINVTILGFAEPGFGFNPGSLRLWLSMVGADVIGVVLPYVLAAIVARDRWGAPALTKAAPWGLVICVLGVGASRLMGFVPGLLTGSTVQLDSRLVAIEDRVKIQAFRLTVTTMLGIWFWLATAVVPDHGSWALLLLRDTLDGGAVVALMSTVIELLPLRFLSGGLLYEHARLLWIGLVAVATGIFVVAIAPQPRFIVRVHGPTMWWVTAGMVIFIIAATVLALHRGHNRRQSLATA